MCCRLRFHGELIPLLAMRHSGTEICDCARRASIKDVIESCGVPHTEVYAIRTNGQEVDFGHIPGDGEVIDVYPGMPPVDVGLPAVLRQEPLDELRFVVDVNVARLGGMLRLLGFDTLYDRHARDEDIAESSAREKRIVLSRDRELLKRRIITHGRLVRAGNPREQFREVVDFFGLRARAIPFSRCARCNGLLRQVEKDEIVDRLEPLTRRYFDAFTVCGACGQIYWKGSHFRELMALVSGEREGDDAH